MVLVQGLGKEASPGFKGGFGVDREGALEETGKEERG